MSRTGDIVQDKLGFRMTDEVLIYKMPDSEVRVEMMIHDENLWLTQEKIAVLFGVKRPAVTKHLANIFSEGELDKDAVCSKMEHTATDGKTYRTNFYNLDAIASIAGKRRCSEYGRLAFCTNTFKRATLWMIAA